jgi:hypothetical protein
MIAEGRFAMDEKNRVYVMEGLCPRGIGIK